MAESGVAILLAEALDILLENEESPTSVYSFPFKKTTLILILFTELRRFKAGLWKSFGEYRSP